MPTPSAKHLGVLIGPLAPVSGHLGPVSITHLYVACGPRVSTAPVASAETTTTRATQGRDRGLVASGRGLEELPAVVEELQ